MKRMPTGWWLLAVTFLFSACGGSGSTDREAGALPGEFREAYGFVDVSPSARYWISVQRGARWDHWLRMKTVIVF